MEREVIEPLSLKKSCKIIQFFFSTEIAFFIIYFLAFNIVIPFLNSNFLLISLLSISGGIFALLIIPYFGWFYKRNLITPLIYLGLGYYMFDRIWNEFLREFRSFMAFFDIGIGLAFMLIIVIIGGIFAIIQIFVVINYWILNFKREKYSAFKDWVQKAKKNLKKHIIVWIFILLSFSIFSIALFGIPIQNYEKIIQPKDYQAEIAFWAKMDPDTYNESRKEALNKHSTLIIPYDTPKWFSDEEDKKSLFINYCLYWKENYSNVRIMPVIHGIPGGFVWDGSAEGSIAFGKRLVNATIEYNLTNVVGFNTDQESPQNDNYLQTLRNRTRNAEATRLWREFIGEIDEKYPGRFEWQTTFGMKSAIDVFDNDNDLDIFVRNNVLSVPEWDEYAPMIYTAGGGVKETDEIIPVDKAHYDLYFEMQLLHDALAKKNMADKIGIYLGITNMEFMGANTTISFKGETVGKGYDALVTQALIAKNFSPERITVFMLNSEPNDPGLGLTGVWDAYGESFLDDFNSSINGEGSSESFSIPTIVDLGDMEDINMDLWLNRGMVIILYGFWIFIIYINRKFILEKKESKEQLESEKAE